MSFLHDANFFPKPISDEEKGANIVQLSLQYKKASDAFRACELIHD